jgi:hypothetical protein
VRYINVCVIITKEDQYINIHREGKRAHGDIEKREVKKKRRTERSKFLNFLKDDKYGLHFHPYVASQHAVTVPLIAKHVSL